MGFADGEKPRRNNGINLEDNTMRVAAGLILASAISVALTGAAWSQTPAAKPVAATPAAPAATPAAAPAAPAAAAAQPAMANPPPPQQAPQPARAACNNPNALG